MRRWLIFALLGPPIGTVVYSLVVAPIFRSVRGLPDVFIWDTLVYTLVGIPLGYVFGIIPAMLVALLHWLLGRRNYRPWWCGLAGLSVGLPFSGILTLSNFNPVNLILFGLMGAIPAVICSWLAGKESA